MNKARYNCKSVYLFYIVDDILSGLWGTDVIVCGDHFICYDCQDINGRSCLMYATSMSVSHKLLQTFKDLSRLSTTIWNLVSCIGLSSVPCSYIWFINWQLRLQENSIVDVKSQNLVFRLETFPYAFVGEWFNFRRYFPMIRFVWKTPLIKVPGSWGMFLKVKKAFQENYVKLF